MAPSMGFPGNNLGNSADDMGSNPDLMPWDQQHNMDPLANNNQNSSSAINVANCVTSSATVPTMTTTAPISDTSGLDVDNLVPGSPLSGRISSNNIPLISKAAGVPPNLQSPTSMGNLPLGAVSPNMANSMKPSLQGIKVPDNDLTPQQLQRREEKLAQIKMIKDRFLPEFEPSNIPGGSSGPVPGGNPGEGNNLGDGGPNAGAPPCKIPMMGPNAASSGNTMGSSMSNMGPGNFSFNNNHYFICQCKHNPHIHVIRTICFDNYQVVQE